MVVLPADHVIHPAPAFRKTLKNAAGIVKKSPETLVTIGVQPSFSATSYGYIRRGEDLAMPKCSAYRVRQFCEKPVLKIAEKFCRSGEYYWNAGIFVWKAETILKLLRQFEPQLGTLLDNIEQSLETKREKDVTKTAFQRMNSISIDYAVMERAKNTVVLEATFDWNDVGTWTALDRLYADKKDKRGNLAISSKILAIDSTGCTVRCDDPEHLVALVGMQNVVVIQTADATLIARKDQEESIRRIAEELKKRNDEWENC
jgi:mannose-1-phosphate guanylyltransferase